VLPCVALFHTKPSAALPPTNHPETPELVTVCLTPRSDTALLRTRAPEDPQCETPSQTPHSSRVDAYD